MKKVLLAVVITVLMLAPAAGFGSPRDPGAAAVLSSCMAGMGEWYNGDFRNDFPWAECIVGYICPCVKIASVIDAADGKSDTSMRIDFWSNPNKK